MNHPSPAALRTYISIYDSERSGGSQYQLNDAICAPQRRDMALGTAIHMFCIPKDPRMYRRSWDKVYCLPLSPDVPFQVRKSGQEDAVKSIGSVCTLPKLRRVHHVQCFGQVLPYANRKLEKYAGPGRQSPVLWLIPSRPGPRLPVCLL